MTKGLVARHRLNPVRYASETVISACRGREDVLLWRALHETKHGLYVDVGAGDPNWESVTRWFYLNGWTGLNVEPHPALYPILNAWRPRDINLNCGVSSEEGHLTFYRVDPTDAGTAWGLSSFDPEAAIQARESGFPIYEMSVPVRTLTNIIEEYIGDKTIDFLKIDVEGYEQSVVSSCDFFRFRPRVLCIEATSPRSPIPAFANWEYILLDAGYHFTLFDGINNYYVRSESPELRSQFNCGLNESDRHRDVTRADMIEPWL